MVNLANKRSVCKINVFRLDFYKSFPFPQLGAQEGPPNLTLGTLKLNQAQKQFT